MTNVINWGGITKLNIPVERVIEGAEYRGLDSIVILGYTKDGEEYFASSQADGGDVLWLLERAKLALIDR